MSELRWKLNRLRVMSPEEIFYRLGRTFLQKIEQRKVIRGWRPLPSKQVKPKNYLFDADYNIEKRWKSLFTLDQRGLAMVLAGQIEFFGHSPVNVGDPVSWHRDPVTGGIAPFDVYGKTINYRYDSIVGNVKFLWELGRHQHLIPLAVAYIISGEKKYKNAIVRQIEGWINKNPFGMGIHWCSALEVALRLISWAVIHSLLYCRDEKKGLFSAVRNTEALGKSIFQQTWFVANFLSRYSSANNHLIGELTGLWTATQVFDLGRYGDKWADIAYKDLGNEVQKQVFLDGVNKEQSTNYHLWVLEYLLFASLIGERVGLPFSSSFTNYIHSMANFLREITPPGGTPPKIGDSDDGFVIRFEPSWPENPYQDVLSAEMLLSGEIPEYLSQKAFWYSLIDGVDITFPQRSWKGLRKTSPYPRIFSEGGYVVLGNDICHLIFDAGSIGYLSTAAHGHADALSFCMAVKGQWWIIDPGTYAYHRFHKWRNYFRGTSAHNTLVVDGRDQSLIGGPFLWTRHAKALLEIYDITSGDEQCAGGLHDGYRNIGIIHKRKISLLSQKNEIHIQDSVSGQGHHKLDLNFHLAPNIQVTKGEKLGIWKITKENNDVSLEILVNNKWNWEVISGRKSPILGWYSPGLDKKQPTFTLNGTWDGEIPLNIITVIKVVNKL